MSQLLEFNYAILNDQYRCVGCKTYSYEVPLDNFIPVPDARNEYIGTYYNPADGNFYYDSAYTQIFDITTIYP